MLVELLRGGPELRRGGLIVGAFFDHGTRLLEVDRKGKISQIGGFLPYGGVTLSSFWVTKEIVYAVDQTRGIDILRYKERRNRWPGRRRCSAIAHVETFRSPLTHGGRRGKLSLLMYLLDATWSWWATGWWLSSARPSGGSGT